MGSADEKVKELVDENMPSSDAYKGPVAEVFSVCIDYVDGEHDRCQVHGKIIVNDDWCTQTIYNREKDSYETIIPWDAAPASLTLTGPYHSFAFTEPFFIDVQLYDRDLIISRGIISFDDVSWSRDYDRPLSIKFAAKHGVATVNWAVWSNGVQATVEVILVSGGRDGEEDDPPAAAKVYGDLIACNSNFEDKETVLFSCTKKKSKNNVIRPGQLIPLLRPAVAVPLPSTLKIKANLLLKKDKDDHDNALCAAEEEEEEVDPTEIVNATVEFPAQPSGTSDKYIIGKDGKNRILLQVIWDEVKKANVKVTLNRKGVSGYSWPTKVYGKITALSNKCGNFKRVLFSKKKNNKDDGSFIEEGVRPGELILPLLRSEFAVPWTSSLIIKADLKLHDNNNASFSTVDPVIANGAAEFPFQPPYSSASSSVKYIDGDEGFIEVEVTCRSYVTHHGSSDRQM